MTNINNPMASKSTATPSGNQITPQKGVIDDKV